MRPRATISVLAGEAGEVHVPLLFGESGTAVHCDGRAVWDGTHGFWPPPFGTSGVVDGGETDGRFVTLTTNSGDYEFLVVPLH